MKLVNSLRNSFVGRIKRTHSWTEQSEGHDDPATISIAAMAKKAKSSPSQTKKTVTFSLDHNTCHASTYTLDEDVVSNFWYSVQEFSAMKREMKQQVAALRISEKVFQDPWAKSLTKIYRTLSASSNDQDDITSRITPLPKRDHDDDDTLGLERKSVRHVAADVTARRRNLRDLVAAMQEKHMSSQDMAEACQAITASSRRFARYLALQLEADQQL